MNELKVSISFSASRATIDRIEQLATYTGLTRSRTIAAIVDLALGRNLESLDVKKLKEEMWWLDA